MMNEKTSEQATANFERAAAIRGLRELADYLAAHPAIPHNALTVNEFTETRAEWDAIRASDVSLAAEASGEYFVLRRVFSGNVKLYVNQRREMEPLTL